MNTCHGLLVSHTPLARRGVAFAAIAALLLLWLSFVPPAGAASINYGTFAGTDVTFQNVTEGSTAVVPLYGPPAVVGNSLDFDPTTYATSSTLGAKLLRGNLTFVIKAGPAARIENVTITEGGHVEFKGVVAPGSTTTSAAVFASGVLDIYEVDFVPINHISVPFSLTFSPSGGTYFQGTDGGGGPDFSQDWTGAVLLQVESILIANGIIIPPGSGATKIAITMTNTLVVTAAAGKFASINKNNVTVDVELAEAIQPTAAGEPDTLVLLGGEHW